MIVLRNTAWRIAERRVATSRHAAQRNDYSLRNAAPSTATPSDASHHNAAQRLPIQFPDAPRRYAAPRTAPLRFATQRSNFTTTRRLDALSYAALRFAPSRNARN